MSEQYTFEEFLQDAKRTESIPVVQKMSNTGVAGFLYLAQVACKMVGMAKASIYYNRPFDVDKMAKLTDEFSMMNYNLQEMYSNNLLFVEKEENPAFDIRLLHSVMGMVDEAGELAEKLRDTFVEGTPLDKAKFAVEMGDSDWFKAIGHDALGIDEVTVRKAVIAKLKQRFPEKFTEENANNRDTDKEDTVAESLIK